MLLLGLVKLGVAFLCNLAVVALLELELGCRCCSLSLLYSGGCVGSCCIGLNLLA